MIFPISDLGPWKKYKTWALRTCSKIKKPLFFCHDLGLQMEEVEAVQKFLFCFFFFFFRRTRTKRLPESLSFFLKAGKLLGRSEMAKDCYYWSLSTHTPTVQINYYMSMHTTSISENVTLVVSMLRTGSVLYLNISFYSNLTLAACVGWYHSR